MKPKLPVFFATPRSKSTALMSLSGPHMTNKLGLFPLGSQTEFFREWSHRYFIQDQNLNQNYRTEYFPLNRENSPISHHFVYPPIYKNRYQRMGHKLKVLQEEKRQGRNYNIKIMSTDITGSGQKDIRFDKDLFHFFADRSFVITRRRNMKTLAFSLLVAVHTNMWHKRANNQERYDDLYKNPITINPELCTIIEPDLRSTAKMDFFESEIEKAGYQYHTFYYEDLTTLEDMKVALDQVFGNKLWRESLTDEYLSSSMTKPLELDYEKIIANYDEVEKRVDSTIKHIFG